MNLLRHFFASTVLVLCCAGSLQAVNLIVSNITNPAAANGKYIQQAGTQYGYNYWKHESQNYYIYNDDYNGSRYWNIDDNLIDDDDCYFYSNDNSSAVSPTSVTSWSVLKGATGVPKVVEEGATPVPEINVKGNGIKITDGDIDPSLADYTKFGSADVSTGTVSRTFVIENIGTAVLTVTGVTISGAQASDFSVTTPPAATVAVDGTTSFVVTFNPSALGNRVATLSIGNNDADENPYDFSIHGYGFTPKNLVLSGITNPAAANGTYVHQGTAFQYEYWKHATLGYYLYNDEYSGGRYWNIDIDTNDTYAIFWSKDHGEDPSPVNVAAWDTTGTSMHGTGTPQLTEAIPVPDISVKGNGVVISDDDGTPSFADHTYFGSVNVSSGTRARTFTIQNTGGATLTLSGSSPYVTISGPAASDFSITAVPSASVNGRDSTTFTLTFNPSAAGTRIAALSIASNDADENPYNFSIQGEGFLPQNLIVSAITTPAGANGKYIHQGTVNEYQYWKHETASYYIYNDDYLGSRYWNIDTDTNDTAVIFFSNNHLEDPSPVSVTSWHPETGNAGTPSIVYDGPEISVKGNSIEIIDGDTAASKTDHTDFDSVNIYLGTVARTFTIKNTGVGKLILSGTPRVAVSGTNASDFTITSVPADSISAGDSTTFQVTFNPSGIGIRTAVISIANNDSDENPYDFSIRGTGFISNISFTDGSAFVPHIIPDSVNQVVGRFLLQGDAAGAVLTAAVIQLNGSTRNGLSNIKLWSSIDSTFQAGVDTKLGATVAVDPGNGNSTSFSGFSSTIDTSRKYYFLTGDIALGATGDIQGVITQNSSLTINGGSLTNTLNNAVLSLFSYPLLVGDEDMAVPRVFTLSQNFPNPFNPATTITFKLAENGNAVLKVYDVIGREVATLVNAGLRAGIRHSVTFDASKLSSGIYFYRLESGKNSLVRKFVLTK